MGKAVPRAIKLRAEELIKHLPDKFSTDFEQNKRAIDELDLVFFSKKDRNLVAGFIARKLSSESR